MSDTTIIHGDALEVLPDQHTASVDMICADPPYRLSNGGFSCRNGRRAPVDKGAWDRSEGIAADTEFNRRWLSECQRILRHRGTIWVAGTHHIIFNLGLVMQGLGFHVLNLITWFKPNASPNLSCRYFTHSTELIIWAAPARTKPLAHTFNYDLMKADNGGKQMRDMWAIPTPGKSEKTHGKHPTQKPIALMRRIIEASTNPGDLVLDPFAGSASTGVACRELGRRFLGIEAEKEYVELGRRRVGQQ